MFLKSTVVALGIGFMVTGSMLTAQAGPEDNVIYKKHTVITLEGSKIDGTREGPNGSVIDVTRRPRFPSAIKVRTSFRIELLQSASAL